MPGVDVRKLEVHVWAEYEEPVEQVAAEKAVGGGAAPAPPRPSTAAPATPLPVPAQAMAYASSNRGGRAGPMDHIRNEWDTVNRRMKALANHWKKMFGFEEGDFTEYRQKCSKMEIHPYYGRPVSGVDDYNPEGR